MDYTKINEAKNMAQEKQKQFVQQAEGEFKQTFEIYTMSKSIINMQFTTSSKNIIFSDFKM
jgi:hypothetical protein